MFCGVGLVRQTTQTAFDPVVYTENIGGERIPVDYGVLHEAASAGDVTAVEGLPSLNRCTCSNLCVGFSYAFCNLIAFVYAALFDVGGGNGRMGSEVWRKLCGHTKPR